MASLTPSHQVYQSLSPKKRNCQQYQPFLACLFSIKHTLNYIKFDFVFFNWLSGVHLQWLLVPQFEDNCSNCRKHSAQSKKLMQGEFLFNCQ